MPSNKEKCEEFGDDKDTSVLKPSLEAGIHKSAESITTIMINVGLSKFGKEEDNKRGE